MAGNRALVRFWGVRGSIPTPGLQTSRFGGNTSCVALTVGNDRLVFDAGTGLRTLGLELAKESNVKLTLLMSHYHWDHMLGLPFFVPIFKPDTILDVYGEHKKDGGPEEAFRRQFAAPHFPVDFSVLPSKLNFKSVKPGDAFDVGSVKIQVGRLHHPQDAICYRAHVDGKSLVYASDHEHEGNGDPGLIEFCKGADLLIYDAMYSDETYPAKKGWGHSTWQEAIRVAKAANVKKLALYHHDPINDDKMLQSIEKKLKKELPDAVISREGMEIEL